MAKLPDDMIYEIARHMSVASPSLGRLAQTSRIGNSIATEQRRNPLMWREEIVQTVARLAWEYAQRDTAYNYQVGVFTPPSVFPREIWEHWPRVDEGILMDSHTLYNWVLAFILTHELEVVIPSDQPWLDVQPEDNINLINFLTGSLILTPPLNYLFPGKETASVGEVIGKFQEYWKSTRIPATLHLIYTHYYLLGLLVLLDFSDPPLCYLRSDLESRFITEIRERILRYPMPYPAPKILHFN